MIKLKKVEIDKYKSFVEKQEINIENGVTRIVGKNESGKTALLEAMAKFNYFDENDVTFNFDSTNDYPRGQLKKYQQDYPEDNFNVITCTFEISDESGTRNVNFSGNDGLHRGFIHGSGELLFKGDYSYTVSNLALYDELFGPSVEDIPIAASHIEYNVKGYVNDFLSFVLPPKDSSGRDIKGASVRGSTVSIPCEYEGDVTILYKKAASEPSGAPDEEITVPDGCEHLLPLIVAAYVWLDDDAERSQYYMSLYREGMSAVKYYAV